MKFNEFESDAVDNVAGRRGQDSKDIHEAIPAIGGLSRGLTAAAKRKVKQRANMKKQSQGTQGTQGSMSPNDMKNTGPEGAVSDTSLANKTAQKAAKRVTNKLLRRGRKVPLPTQDKSQKVADFEVDNVKGDEVTLKNPNAKRDPSQPSKFVVNKKDVEPIIKKMMGNDDENE